MKLQREQQATTVAVLRERERGVDEQKGTREHGNACLSAFAACLCEAFSLCAKHAYKGVVSLSRCCCCCNCQCCQVLGAVKEQIENGEKLVAGWAETKPWITEEETKSATEKVGELFVAPAQHSHLVFLVLACRVISRSSSCSSRLGRASFNSLV